MQTKNTPDFERKEKFYQPQFKAEYESSIIRLISEILFDTYPDKTAIVTSRPLSWFKFSGLTPSSILDLGKMTGMQQIEMSEEKPLSNIGPRVLECSQISELVEGLKNPKLSAMVLDHSLPIGGRSHIGNEIRKALPDKFSKIRKLEETAGLTLLGAANPNIEKIVSIVPFGVLFSNAHSQWRQDLLQSFNPRAVIELPSNTIFPFSGIKLALLYLEKSKKDKLLETIFYSLKERGDLLGIESQTWFKDLKDSLAGQPSQIGFTVKIPKDGPWHSAFYSPKLKDVETLIKGLGDSVKLGEICDIISGFRYSRTSVKGKSGIPIIRGRDLRNPNISSDEVDRFKIDDEIRDRFKTQPGDILIQKIGESPANVVVTEALEGAVVGDTVIIIRPKKPDVQPESISQFLNSSAAQRIIRARQAATIIPNLNISVLREIPIPILPAEVTRQLYEMARMEQQLVDQAEKARAMRLSLFNVKNKEEFEEHLQALRTQVQSLSSSVVQSEDLEFQIRNFYPFPLAYPYRFLKGIISHSECYMGQLRMAENLLAFLGSISLALIESKKQEINVDLKKCWRGGISPGTWEHICTQSVKILRNVKDEPFASALCSLWKRGKKDTKFTLTIKNLIKKINDFKHHRGPKVEEEFKVACEEIEPKLKDCMAAVSFFIQHPIRLVQDMDVVRGTTTVILHTLSFNGDHPGLSQEKLEFPYPLPKDTLYIEISPNNWASLYPFITVQYCPLCQTRETYFIDRWQGTNKPGGLKSFERGHTVDEDEIGKEIERLCTEG